MKKVFSAEFLKWIAKVGGFKYDPEDTLEIFISDSISFNPDSMAEIEEKLYWPFVLSTVCEKSIETDSPYSIGMHEGMYSVRAEGIVCRGYYYNGDNPSPEEARIRAIEAMYKMETGLEVR